MRSLASFFRCSACPQALVELLRPARPRPRPRPRQLVSAHNSCVQKRQHDSGLGPAASVEPESLSGNRKRPKKDAAAPKRALSAYMLWCAEERHAVLRDNPGMAVTDVSKELGKRWKALGSPVSSLRLVEFLEPRALALNLLPPYLPPHPLPFFPCPLPSQLFERAGLRFLQCLVTQWTRAWRPLPGLTVCPSTVGSCRG